MTGGPSPHWKSTWAKQDTSWVVFSLIQAYPPQSSIMNVNGGIWDRWIGKPIKVLSFFINSVFSAFCICGSECKNYVFIISLNYCLSWIEKEQKEGKEEGREQERKERSSSRKIKILTRTTNKPVDVQSPVKLWPHWQSQAGIGHLLYTTYLFGEGEVKRIAEKKDNNH